MAISVPWSSCNALGCLPGDIPHAERYIGHEVRHSPTRQNERRRQRVDRGGAALRRGEKSSHLLHVCVRYCTSQSGVHHFTQCACAHSVRGYGKYSRHYQPTARVGWPSRLEARAWKEEAYYSVMFKHHSLFGAFRTIQFLSMSLCSSYRQDTLYSEVLAHIYMHFSFCLFPIHRGCVQCVYISLAI